MAEDSRRSIEADEVAIRYARRPAAAPGDRYSLFDPAALAEAQDRLRAQVGLWRAHGWLDLNGRSIAEVGCGSGGNLLDLLRLGARAEHLTGIELLADRCRAARSVLPPALRLIEGDALAAEIAPASQQAVLQFTVFSSLLEAASRQQLADSMWRWVAPGGGVLWYDFTVNNPRNADVRGVPLAEVRQLFPQGRISHRRLTLAPPIARALAFRHPWLHTLARSLPPLRTHLLAWIVKS